MGLQNTTTQEALESNIAGTVRSMRLSGFMVTLLLMLISSGIAQSTIANVTTTTQQTQSNPLVKAHVLLDDTASESETHNQKHELRLAVNESVLREAVTQFRKKDSLPTQPVKDATQLNPPGRSTRKARVLKDAEY